MTATAATAHATGSGRKRLAMPTTTRSCTTIVPKPPTRMSTMPLHARNPARVTTNDGTPILAMIVPCSAPISRPTSSATPTATHHGCSASSRRAITAAPTPLT